MLWREALQEVMEEKIKKQGKKPTNVARDAKISRNFFTRLFAGNIAFVDLDLHLEPLAKELGIDVWDLLLAAKQKKTA